MTPAEDPGWLAALDPRVLQAIVTLLTTTIAACTALFIAIFVYAKQKNLDARIRLTEETRRTCAEFAELCSTIVDEPGRANQPVSALQSVGAKLAKANYYENLLIMQQAPESLVRAGQDMSKSYGAALRSLYESFARGESSDTDFPDLVADLFEKRAQFVMVARGTDVPSK